MLALGLVVLALGLAPACDSDKGADAAKPAAAAAGESKRESAAAAGAKADGEPAADAKAAAKEEDYGGEFCAAIIPCFERLEFAGNFTADVTVDIEPDGKVASVSFTGEAPKPVQTCIVDDIKAITLSSYNGKPGRTRCTQSGQLSGGSRMVMADSTYEVREPAP